MGLKRLASCLLPLLAMSTLCVSSPARAYVISRSVNGYWRGDPSSSVPLRTIIDEYSRECLAIDVRRKMTSEQVLERLAQLFLERRTPRYLRSDNGPEFVAKAVREWLPKVGVRTLYIEPGSPWENGYLESFNGKLRDELLAREVFDTLLEAKVLVARWRRHYSTVRPHSSLDYRPPAPEAVLPRQQSPALVPMYAACLRL